MNRHDPSDADLREAFAARLRSAPQAPEFVRARTLAAIDAEVPPRRQRRPWTLATHWWQALAMPGRFALAAAIVIVGGSLSLHTLKATPHDGNVIRATGSSTITLDHRATKRMPQLARSGSMQIVTPDVRQALRRISRLARNEHAEIVRQTEPVSGAASVRLRVPPARLAAAMRAVATIGGLRASSMNTVDLTATLADLDMHLRRAAPGVQFAALTRERRRLAGRVATATLAITITTRELSRNPPRPTNNLFDRGNLLATSESVRTHCGIWAVDDASCRLLAARTRSAGSRA